MRKSFVITLNCRSAQDNSKKCYAAAPLSRIVVEQSPALTAGEHDRRRLGLNHLAFHAGSRQDVDSLAATARCATGPRPFADKHSYAGGPEHYAAYLAGTDGFAVELVAAS